MKCLYKILGIARTATAEEIKAAYRRLSMEHHPDRGGDAEKFREITEAYQVLGDMKRRQSYDECGCVADVVGRAMSMLEEIFEHMVDSVEADTRINFKEVAAECVCKELEEAEKARKRAILDLSKYEALRGRLRVKEGDNIFEVVLDRKEGKLRERLVALNTGIEVCKAATGMLENYEDYLEERLALMEKEAARMAGRVAGAGGVSKKNPRTGRFQVNVEDFFNPKIGKPWG